MSLASGYHWGLTASTCVVVVKVSQLRSDDVSESSPRSVVLEFVKCVLSYTRAGGACWVELKQDVHVQVGTSLSGAGGVQWRANQLCVCEGMACMWCSLTGNLDGNRCKQVCRHNSESRWAARVFISRLSSGAPRSRGPMLKSK